MNMNIVHRLFGLGCVEVSEGVLLLLLKYLLSFPPIFASCFLPSRQFSPLTSSAIAIIHSHSHSHSERRRRQKHKRRPQAAHSNRPPAMPWTFVHSDSALALFLLMPFPSLRVFIAFGSSFQFSHSHLGRFGDGENTTTIPTTALSGRIGKRRTSSSLVELRLLITNECNASFGNCRRKRVVPSSRTGHILDITLHPCLWHVGNRGRQTSTRAG